MYHELARLHAICMDLDGQAHELSAGAISANKKLSGFWCHHLRG